MNMKRKDEYIGWIDSKLQYVAQGISKAKFIDLAQANYQKSYISKNWIKERASTGANEQTLEKLKANPGHFLILDENYEIIKKIKL